MEIESLALEAFQRHPDFCLHRTVSILVDVLFIKHLFIPCGIEPYSSQAVEIQNRIVAAFHRDFQRTTYLEGKSDRPEAYLIRMLQYEALHLPSNPSIQAMESAPGAAGSFSALLDQALGVLATDPTE